MGRGVRDPGCPLSFWTLVVGFHAVALYQILGLHDTPMFVAADSLERVSAVTGGEAVLPCDVRAPQGNDVLQLIVWYKDEEPIYSYDSRLQGTKAHWSEDKLLEGRMTWHPEPPQSLNIHDVIPTDRALYRCRVDYKISPTRNFKVQLDVIELPEKPKIFDEFDKEIVGFAGPYVEDTGTKLTCVVSGGKPAPRLRWWRNDQVITTLAPVDDGSRLSFLELRVLKLSRDYNEAVYTCTADNTVMVPPSRVNVQIQLYLRPLTVEIIPREQPLAVDQTAEITCKSAGARPPAMISWWIDDKEITNVIHKFKESSDNRNETTSTIRWTPRMEHNGLTLTCRASHTILPHTSLETSIKLQLHYAPSVELEFGSKMNPNDIEEGDDVYFDCIVKSFPPAYKVIWEHNGQMLAHGQRPGIIKTSTHLALQRVTKEQSGRYTCIASNVEGDGKSQPVNLQVIFKPVCKLSKPVIVGVAINELARVTCDVDAYPPPITFQWLLNNSVGTVEIATDKTTIEEGRSILSVTPSSETDYGTLTCRATNLAGQQIDSCLYTLLPAVQPDRPYNCVAQNVTDDSAEIRCATGYDGGLHTIYFIEAWMSGKNVMNVSTATPVWKLNGLASGKALKLTIYAYNARGRSDVTTLRIHTLSRQALFTEVKTATTFDMSWMLGIISGITGTLVVVIIVVILAKRQQNLPAEYAAPSQVIKSYKNSESNGNHSPLQADDKNPDVVPLGKDLNVLGDPEKIPDPPPYGAVLSPLVGLSKSAQSLHHHELRSFHTPNTPGSDAHSIGTLADDRRSITSGTLSRRREIVTTRTPLLANSRESRV